MVVYTRHPSYSGKHNIVKLELSCELGLLRWPGHSPFSTVAKGFLIHQILCLMNTKNAVHRQGRVSVYTSLLRERRTLPREIGKGPEQVASEVTWSKVFILLLQSIAQPLC
jgi:hypothetical protein